MKKMFVLIALGWDDDDNIVFVSEDKETLEQYVADRDSDFECTIKHNIYYKMMFDNYPGFTDANPRRHSSTPEQSRYDSSYNDWIEAAEAFAEKQTVEHFNLDPNADHGFTQFLCERQKYKIVSVDVLDRRI